MIRTFAALVALTLLGASDARANAARYFLGTWKCAGTMLTFGQVAEGSPWLRLTYGGPPSEGQAVVGFVPSLHAWVFRDFHADGAYADLASPGPSDDRWQWTGPYYPPEGGPPLDSRMTYLTVSSGRFDRRFEILRGQAFLPTGTDTCLRVTS